MAQTKRLVVEMEVVEETTDEQLYMLLEKMEDLANQQEFVECIYDTEVEEF